MQLLQTFFSNFKVRESSNSSEVFDDVFGESAAILQMLKTLLCYFGFNFDAVR